MSKRGEGGMAGGQQGGGPGCYPRRGVLGSGVVALGALLVGWRAHGQGARAANGPLERSLEEAELYRPHELAG